MGHCGELLCTQPCSTVDLHKHVCVCVCVCPLYLKQSVTGCLEISTEGCVISTDRKNKLPSLCVCMFVMHVCICALLYTPPPIKSECVVVGCDEFASLIGCKSVNIYSA